MRIYNRAGIDCDKKLWRAAATAIGLDEPIMGTDFEYRKILVVVIHREKPRTTEQSSLYGHFTLTRIDLYPCQVCTFGAVTILFLSLLACVWLRQFYLAISSEEWREDFCNDFARNAFPLLGGRVASEKCHENEFTGQLDRVDEVAPLIETLLRKYASGR